MRSGTENVPAIAGLGVACEEITGIMMRIMRTLGSQGSIFKRDRHHRGTHINGCVGEDSAPHIVSVSFEEIDKSEALYMP